MRRHHKVITQPTPKATITVTSSNTSYGTVSGGGTYDIGSTVTITATPTSNTYGLYSWNDNNVSNSRTITVTGNATYTATFVPTMLSNMKTYLDTKFSGKTNYCYLVGTYNQEYTTRDVYFAIELATATSNSGTLYAFDCSGLIGSVALGSTQLPSRNQTYHFFETHSTNNTDYIIGNNVRGTSGGSAYFNAFMVHVDRTAATKVSLVGNGVTLQAKIGSTTCKWQLPLMNAIVTASSSNSITQSQFWLCGQTPSDEHPYVFTVNNTSAGVSSITLAALPERPLTGNTKVMDMPFLNNGSPITNSFDGPKYIFSLTRNTSATSGTYILMEVQSNNGVRSLSTTADMSLPESYGQSMMERLGMANTTGSVMYINSLSPNQMIPFSFTKLSGAPTIYREATINLPTDSNPQTYGCIFYKNGAGARCIISWSPAGSRILTNNTY